MLYFGRIWEKPTYLMTRRSQVAHILFEDMGDLFNRCNCGLEPRADHKWLTDREGASYCQSCLRNLQKDLHFTLRHLRERIGAEVCKLGAELQPFKYGNVTSNFRVLNVRDEPGEFLLLARIKDEKMRTPLKLVDVDTWEWCVPKDEGLLETGTQVDGPAIQLGRWIAKYLVDRHTAVSEGAQEALDDFIKRTEEGIF